MLFKRTYERGRRAGIREATEKYANPRYVAEHWSNQIRLAVNEANGRPYFPRGAGGTVPMDVDRELSDTWGSEWRSLFQANPLSGVARGAANL